MAKSQRSKSGNPPGFSDEQQAFEPMPAALPDPDFKVIGKFTVGPGGRVLIPAAARAALGVQEGDVLVASMAAGELRLMSMATAVKRAQALVRQHLPVGSPSMVDELIAERRRENERECE